MKSRPIPFILFLFLPAWTTVWAEEPDALGVDQLEIAGTDTSLKLWKDAHGDTTSYAISKDGGKTFSEKRTAKHQIKLRFGDFTPDPGRAAPPVPPMFEAAPSAQLFIVQFQTQPLREYHNAIEELGGKMLAFLPHHAYIARFNPDLKAAMEALPFVRWVGPFHPAYRLEEFMLENLENREQAYGLQKYNIMVFESGMAEKRRVAEVIYALGGVVDREHAGKFLLEATLTPDQLFTVITLDEVLFVDRWSPGETDMDTAREMGGAVYLSTVAGFNGEGVRGEIIDLGFNMTHGDFASRPLIEHTAVSSNSHGAACSGILFADGSGNPMGTGLMPMGQGIVADWDVVSIGTPRYDHTGELVQPPYEAVLQTASVGSDRTTEYTTISADTDAALFDFDIVHCQSQSNAGTRDSRPQAWAKNIISGGAINHQDTLDRSDDCWCNDASIGPATDGRIKPDVSGYYDAIFTTTTGSTTAYTTSFGGTSGGTPIVCGYVGLIFQMWSEGVFGNPVDGGTVFDNRCHMTTAKALVINSASPWDFTGQAHDLTRVHQGWGFPDVQRLYDDRDRIFIVDEADLIENLQTNSYSLRVLPSEDDLRVTMVYADPPGNPAATIHRINDLSLRVTSPSGTQYWGNQGLLDGNWSTPGGAANEVDTVENVFVPDPECGIWTVEVIASEIIQDGHVETPNVDADYALVAKGAVEIDDFAFCFDAQTQVVCAPADLTMDIDVSERQTYHQRT